MGEQPTAKKAWVTLKLIALVALITVGVILVLLNIREAQPIHLIVKEVNLPPAATIAISFTLGVIFTVLVSTIRKARKR